MSLSLNKLEQARDIGGGVIQARCPACAENGSDKTGKHLRVYADGRYGCCVFPKDREHRKRIFAIAGDTAPRPFKVKVAAVKPVEAQSVKDALTACADVEPLPAAAELPLLPSEQNLGTVGTSVSMSPAYAEVHTCIAHTCKDNEGGVPAVPSVERLPYVAADGTLIIPFDSPERYHWWKNGQTVAETLKELSSAKEQEIERKLNESPY